MEVINLGVVSDHGGEQVVVLGGRGHLQMGRRQEGRVHLDHLAIALDINHVGSKERR